MPLTKRLHWSILLNACLLLGWLSACTPSDSAPLPTTQQVLQQLQTADDLATTEIVVSKIIRARDDQQLWSFVGERKIIISCEAHIKMGVCLTCITPADIQIDHPSKSLSLTLPLPKLVSFNMKPEGTKVAYTQVDWPRTNFSIQEINQLTQIGERTIRQSLPQMRLEAQCKTHCQQTLTRLFMLAGFEQVQIQFRTNTA
jgi:hypothetical protein